MPEANELRDSLQEIANHLTDALATIEGFRANSDEDPVTIIGEIEDALQKAHDLFDVDARPIVREKYGYAYTSFDQWKEAQAKALAAIEAERKADAATA
jgi:hypothetical protein